MPHRNHATAYSCVQEGSATQNPEPAVVKLVGEELSVTILVHREPMEPTAPRLVRWVGWCWARPSCWCCRCLWWRKGDVPCVVVSDGDVLGDAVDDGDVLGVDDVVAVPEPGQLPPSDRQLPLPDGMDGQLLIQLDWNFKLLFFFLAWKHPPPINASLAVPNRNFGEKICNMKKMRERKGGEGARLSWNFFKKTTNLEQEGFPYMIVAP